MLRESSWDATRGAASAAQVAPSFSVVLLKFSVELLNWNGARTELGLNSRQRRSAGSEQLDGEKTIADTLSKKTAVSSRACLDGLRTAFRNSKPLSGRNQDSFCSGVITPRGPTCKARRNRILRAKGYVKTRT